MNRRIWLDVTDFLRWPGTMTGFQHIQYNIIRLYLADRYNIGFFTYDEAAHAFNSVTFDLDAIVQDGVVLPQETARSVAASRSLPRRMLGKLSRHTPPSVKKIAKQVIRSRHTQGKSAQVSVRAPFEKQDIILVLGGIWHGHFAQDLTHIKLERGFRLVHIVHDMIPWRVPGYVVEDLPAVYTTYSEAIFRIADGLIINSRNSKKDAEAFMKERGIKPPPSVVFRLADEAQSVAPQERKGVPKHGFILSVGTIEGRKNHMLLYYAYKEALRRGISLPPLVIAGRNGWLTEDFRYLIAHDPDIKGCISIHNGVTNSELTWLYEHCLFTIWPSFYEGWGMPVAESLAHAKLCLTSDTSSMPEIGPGLVDYFSPYDSNECLEKIQTYLDPKTLAAKEKVIAKEYKVTTWYDMYTQIRNFIDTL